MKHFIKEARLEVYVKALELQKQYKYPHSMCYCLECAEEIVLKTFCYPNAPMSEKFPELFSHKPENAVTWWFHPNDNEIRIRLWETIIKEMEESR
jgi:hypothetical protein